MNNFLFLLFALFGSFLQTSAGFGNGVLLMAVLPFFLPFLKAVAFNQISCLFLTVLVVTSKRKDIRWKILLPLLFPMVVSTVFFTIFSFSVEQRVLKILLGVLFLIMAVFFLLSGKRMKMKPTTLKGVAMGTLAGLSNGFTGISGPPAALYLRPAIEDNNEYLATIQGFFLFQSAVGLFTRIGGGALSGGDIVPIIFLLLGTLGGAWLGSALGGRIDSGKMQRYVYGFVALYGVYVIVSQLFF